MKKILFLLMVVFFLLISSGCYERMLIVNEKGKIISEKKSYGKISLIYVRKDGTFETFSSNRGSVTFKEDKNGVYYHGTGGGPHGYYHRGHEGMYYGGYSYYGRENSGGRRPIIPGAYGN